MGSLSMALDTPKKNVTWNHWKEPEGKANERENGREKEGEKKETTAEFDEVEDDEEQETDDAEDRTMMEDEGEWVVQRKQSDDFKFARSTMPRGDLPGADQSFASRASPFPTFSQISLTPFMTNGMGTEPSTLSTTLSTSSTAPAMLSTTSSAAVRPFCTTPPPGSWQEGFLQDLLDPSDPLPGGTDSGFVESTENSAPSAMMPEQPITNVKGYEQMPNSVRQLFFGNPDGGRRSFSFQQQQHQTPSTNQNQAQEEVFRAFYRDLLISLLFEREGFVKDLIKTFWMKELPCYTTAPPQLSQMEALELMRFERNGLKFLLEQLKQNPRNLNRVDQANFLSNIACFLPIWVLAVSMTVLPSDCLIIQMGLWSHFAQELYGVSEHDSLTRM